MANQFTPTDKVNVPKKDADSITGFSLESKSSLPGAQKGSPKIAVPTSGDPESITGFSVEKRNLPGTKAGSKQFSITSKRKV